MPFNNKRPRRPTRLAKALRNSATDAEKRLWSKLQSSQLEGVKFRRQEPIKEYIVDFVSLQKKLIIELDGGQHAEAIENDRQRDDCLAGLGFKVLRFWNNEVFENLGGVLEVIRQHCKV
jgi:very-short-patch-repair endonuclease